MATKIIFQVLDVGQGTGNFIEIYDDDDLTHAVLIDLGSERAKEEAGGPSVEYIVAKLKEMEQPTLNALLLSHSDSDHINLLSQLLDAFEPVDTPDVDQDDTLLIEYARYGGAYPKFAKRGGTNLLKRVAEYMPDDEEPESMAAGESSFIKGAKSKPLLEVDDVSLYVWIANATDSSALVPDTMRAGKKRAADPFAINTNSLVVVVEYGGVQFVATGDATGVTLSEANTVAKVKGVKETFLDQVFMVTLPHHGSYATTFNLQGAGDDADEKESLPGENLTTFAEACGAETVTGSAERVRRFKHPSAVVMSYFWSELDPFKFYSDPLLTDKRHFYVGYFAPDDGWERDVGGMTEEWPKFEWWYAVQSQKNVFTNFYYEHGLQGGTLIPPDPGQEVAWLASKPPQPPLGVAWSMFVEADGTRWMERMTNRKTLLALRSQILRGVPPVLLDAPDLRRMAVHDSAGPRRGPGRGPSATSAPPGPPFRSQPPAPQAPPAPAPAAPPASAAPERPAAPPPAPRGLRVVP